jgi:ADP-heptose:LPS heptosyltransferase
MSIYPIYKKIGRIAQSIAKLPIVFIKRAHARAISFLCGMLTDPHWLLDYMPGTSYRRKTVLIVRLDLIGDFILWLDSAKELKKVYPASYLVLYGNSVWADVARQLPYWDEVIAVDVPRLRTNLIYRLKIFFNLRRKSFDIALQPTFSREYVGDLTVRASNAKQRIGFLGDLNNITEANKRRTDAWYTELVTVVDGSNSKELQVNANFISSLQGHTYLPDIPYLPALCDLNQELIIFKRYTVILPGASWQPRAWPAENFAELIIRLSFDSSKNFVLCGSADEISLCAKIVSLCPRVNVQNLAGRTSLLEMTEILRCAELVVANESGAIHIATATGTPSVCITGGGHYGRFVPYPTPHSSGKSIPQTVAYPLDCFGCNWICPFKTNLQGAVPCIANISVLDVVNKCEDSLKSLINQAQTNKP